MEFILLASILFQLSAGIFSIRLIRISGSYKPWLLVLIVVFLMMIRRIITLQNVISGKIEGSTIIESEITALVISVILPSALFLMIPVFRKYRNNELELLKKNTDLAKAKKHAEEGEALKTSFLQNLSHEIRTPMNGILGFSDLLLNLDIRDTRQKKYLKIIKNNGEQLLAIVSDLQTISHLNAKKLKIFQEQIVPAEIVNHLYYTFLLQAEKTGINLKIQMDKNPESLNTDKTKLIQILTNLISNALKFTQAGYVEFGYLHEGQFITFFVRDTGIGISKEHQKLIFDRFVQANDSIHEKYGGTGLGLSISKGLIELLGGNIRVKSEPGKGTEFSFSLPCPKNTN